MTDKRSFRTTDQKVPGSNPAERAKIRGQRLVVCEGSILKSQQVRVDRVDLTVKDLFGGRKVPRFRCTKSQQCRLVIAVRRITVPIETGSL
jgi:hypothetical protein